MPSSLTRTRRPNRPILSNESLPRRQARAPLAGGGPTTGRTGARLALEVLHTTARWESFPTRTRKRVCGPPAIQARAGGPDRSRVAPPRDADLSEVPDTETSHSGTPRRDRGVGSDGALRPGSR
jgi:hypothetical protein